MAYAVKYRGLEVLCSSAKEVDQLADVAEKRNEDELCAEKEHDMIAVSAFLVEDETTWPDEGQAAAILGASVKAVIRYAQQGKIEMKKRRRPGRKPMNIFNPQDLLTTRTRNIPVVN